ncbi:MAG: ABC transporter substrate-binding protein, partial [Actinomycetota bacterium]
MVRRSVAFTFVLCLVVSACSTSDGGNDEGGGSASDGGASGEPIVIGFPADLTTDWAYYDVPMQEGAQFAVDQINEAGGVLGRPLEVISRDDGGQTANAVTLANQLVSSEGVALICGTFLSNVGLAVSDFAKQKQMLFVAAEPLSAALTWEQGNRYTWRLRSSTYMQNVMLADAAAALDATRWVTIAPNYEYGHSAVAEFKKLLKARRPEVEFVAAQWPAQGKLEAGPTVQALLAAEPEAIYNATFAGDLAKLVREGTVRGLFEGREVVSLLTGEPEYLDPLGAEAPEGWIVTG